MDIVSIIMPLYNSEAFVEDSVNSVLRQTYPNWELWIVEDHSTDQSYALAMALEKKDARIHVVRTERNSGTAEARNLGIHCATGQFIAFLDSDDLWYDKKLEKQLELLRSSGGSLCFTSYAMLEEIGKERRRVNYIVPKTIDYKYLLRENVIGCSTVIIESDIAKLHPLKSNYAHEDYVLWLELLRCGVKAVGCQEVLVDWRYHSNSRSYNKMDSIRNRWRVYREAVGLSAVSSLFYLFCYGIAGLIKYRKR